MSQPQNWENLLQEKLLLKQGAEAKLYTGIFFGRPAVAKERFSKSYRHPVLDRALTVRRIRAEVKCIQRCRANGLHCCCFCRLSNNCNHYTQYVITVFETRMVLRVVMVKTVSS